MHLRILKECFCRDTIGIQYLVFSLKIGKIKKKIDTYEELVINNFYNNELMGTKLCEIYEGFGNKILRS